MYDLGKKQKLSYLTTEKSNRNLFQEENDIKRKMDRAPWKRTENELALRLSVRQGKV
jgi:hypothetical protein